MTPAILTEVERLALGRGPKAVQNFMQAGSTRVPAVLEATSARFDALLVKLEAGVDVDVDVIEFLAARSESDERAES